MRVYSHQYLDVNDVSKHNNLDVEKVIDALNNSDVSYGTNGDTLISKQTFENILKNADIIKDNLDYAEYKGDEIMISLGC
jgi:hypothetical protein